MGVFRATTLAALLSIPFATSGAEPAAWWLRADVPARAVLGDLDGALGVAISDDGKAAAAAFPADDGGREVTVRLARPGDVEPRTVDLPGDVRALRFSREGDAVLAIVAKRFKRRPPETNLFAIDLATLKPRRLIHLPHDARDFAQPSGSGAFVVATTDELRTFEWPDLTSGPLYRVTGDNRALLALDGRRFLVAQGDRVLLVDLDDPPGEEQMPIRGTTTGPAPIVELGRSPDPGTVAARLEGDVDAVLLPVPEDVPPAPASPSGPETAEPSPAGDEAATDEDDRAGTKPREERAIGRPSETPPPSPEPVGDAASAPERAEPPPSDHGAPAAEPPTASPRSPGTEPRTGPCTIRGTVVGSRSDAVRAVVAFGPDSPFREAARVPLAENGAYCFEDLETGSYRLVPASAGDRVVESDPPFQVVRIGEDPVTARPFEVLRVR